MGGQTQQEVAHVTPAAGVAGCSRRSLLALSAAGLLAGATGLVRAQTAAAADAPVVLEPIALAILHHARGDAAWSSRQKLRSYLKTGGPAGVFGLGGGVASQLSPEARAITAAWQNLMAAGDVFQRSRDFQKLVALVDAYAARVLAAERYWLPLNGQGFVSYDYLDQELLNDAGLVEAGSRFAATRFATLDQGAVGALQVMNLHVQQLSPSLKAPTELYRVAVPDTALAERLLAGKAGTLQLLELRLRGDTPRCFPRGEAMKGTAHPLPALAVELLVIDAGTGAKLFAKPIESKLRQGRNGYCAVA